MDILDIAIVKQLAGGGGGSGTDNYNDLSNLPKINDVTLSGNKSSSALGLQSEITSENKLDSDLIDDTDQDNKFVTSTEKNTWNAKQNAIDADHKINADYVDDSTSTNKFVTATDKETWNAKQNAIDNSHKLSSDLVDDANHTNKFVTSTEKNTWNGKQNAIDSDHKLSSSLVSFTTAEAAALASGIDSTKVAQISTNQSNILYAIQNGVKNLCPVDTLTTSGGETNHVDVDLPAGTYHIYCTTTASTYSVVLKDANNANLYYHDHSGSPLSIDVTITGTAKTFYIWNSSAATFSDVMICPKVAWDAEPNVFRPYALPNYDLTRLEAEDRAALAEVVDSGAKNLLQLAATTNASVSGCHVTLSGTASASATQWYGVEFTVSTSGSYVFAVKATSGTIPTTALYNITDDANVKLYDNGTGGNDTVYLQTGKRYKVGSYLHSGTSYNQQLDVMVCTKAAFGVSNKFVPYRPNYDLVLSDIDNLEAKSSVVLDMSGKRYMELSIVSYTGTARGALLISFTTQTLSITPSLYYIGTAVGEFTEPIALSGGAVGAAVEAVTRSSDNTKLYFQCPVNTWAAPIIIPLTGEVAKVKYSARWLDSIPT